MYKYRFRFYISGSVTRDINRRGYLSVYRKFDYKSDVIERITCLRPVNPMLLCRPTWSWLRCMVVCLWHLVHKCDAIYMLPDYKESRGARIELRVAKLLKYPIVYDETT